MLLLDHKHSLLLKKSDFYFYGEWCQHRKVEHRKMPTCYLNRLPKITWLVSDTTGRYSQPFSLFAFVLTTFVSHTIRTYHGLICDSGCFRPYSALQAERMVTNLKQTHYPTLIVVSLSMPLSMCSSFLFSDWVPRPIINLSLMHISGTTRHLRIG